MALISPLANLFMLIQERITSAVPAIQWVDQNFGQLENYTEGYRPPVKFPCALIDLTGWTYEDLSGGAQSGIGRVVISISTAPLSNSNQLTPVLYKEKALEFYEIEHAVVKALHNWQPPGFDRLLRRNMDKQEREDAIRERVLVFEISYTDTTGQPVRQIVPRPDPKVGGDQIV